MHLLSPFSLNLPFYEHKKRPSYVCHNHLSLNGIMWLSCTPTSNLGYLAPPGQFFMGAKLFIGTPWMGNEGVLKKIGLGYVKVHGFYGTYRI